MADETPNESEDFNLDDLAHPVPADDTPGAAPPDAGADEGAADLDALFDEERAELGADTDAATTGTPADDPDALEALDEFAAFDDTDRLDGADTPTPEPTSALPTPSAAGDAAAMDAAPAADSAEPPATGDDAESALDDDLDALFADEPAAPAAVPESPAPISTADAAAADDLDALFDDTPATESPDSANVFAGLDEEEADAPDEALGPVLDDAAAVAEAESVVQESVFGADDATPAAEPAPPEADESDPGEADQIFADDVGDAAYSTAAIAVDSDAQTAMVEPAAPDEFGLDDEDAFGADDGGAGTFDTDSADEGPEFTDDFAPTEMAAPAARKSGRGAKLGVTVLALMLVGTIGWGVMSFLGGSAPVPTQTAAVPRPEATPAPAPAPAVEPELAVAPPAPATEPEAPPAAETRLPAAEPPVAPTPEPAPVAPMPEAVPPAPAPAPAPERVEVAQAPTPAPAPAAPAPSEVVDVDALRARLKINAIRYRLSDARAVVNLQRVHEGDMVDGVRVVTIQADRILFEAGGTRFTVRF